MSYIKLKCTKKLSLMPGTFSASAMLELHGRSSTALWRIIGISKDSCSWRSSWSWNNRLGRHLDRRQAFKKPSRQV